MSNTSHCTDLKLVAIQAPNLSLNKLAFIRHQMNLFLALSGSHLDLIKVTFSRYKSMRTYPVLFLNLVSHPGLFSLATQVTACIRKLVKT